MCVTRWWMSMACLAMLLTTASTCAAEPSAPTDGDAARPVQSDTVANPDDRAKPESDSYELLESTRRSVRWTAEWLARGVDSWFGSTPFEEGGKVSDGRVSAGYFKRQEEGKELSLRFNARFRLPNLEHRAYLFVGRFDDRELLTDTPAALSRREALLSDGSAPNNSFFAGLGVPLLKALDFRIGVHGGFKLYAQARYLRSWATGEMGQFEFRETTFWTRADQVGSTTAVSYEYALSPSMAVRWLNSATITQEVRHFNWSTGLGIYHSLGGQRLLSLEMLAGGATGSGAAVSNFGPQVKYELPIHKDWLRAEFLLGHFWPLTQEGGGRRPGWAGGCTVHMSF